MRLGQGPRLGAAVASDTRLADRPDFKYDPGLLTEVEIRFTPAESGTLVEIEHRLIERMGERGVGMRDAFTRGWGLLLDSFMQHAN